jgi:3-deoxy-D-manno-octulosonate 8-phosphate phosphatase (KDO 8-P phosphatase)
MPTLLQSDADIAADISCIFSDVDGVMTDCRIIYDSAGAETKNFHVRDGVGIKLWMRSGFAFGIITARESAMVRRRAEDLGIEHLYQGIGDKASAARELCEKLDCSLRQVCYIGDDLPDLEVMKSVALAVAPADASADAREAAHWVLHRRGGDGAVRELVERLLRAKQRWEEHLR